MQKNNSQDKLFYRLNDVKNRIGVSGSSIWAWSKIGKFPAPIKISSNVTVWKVSEVEFWAEARIAASQKPEV